MKLWSVIAVFACAFLAGDQAWAAVSGGTQRWTASYGASAPAFSYAVAVTPDGSTVFVGGKTVYGTNRPGKSAVLAYEAGTGAEKWTASYKSSDNPEQRDWTTRAAVSPDGSRLFVVGASACFSCTGTFFNGSFVIAYDVSTGERVWAAKYANDLGAYSITVSPDGSRVFINGQQEAGFKSMTVAYDASTGTKLWDVQSDDAPVYWQALAASPDGSTLFVAATGPGRDFRTTAYDTADGTERWSATYADSVPSALAASPDGSAVFVAGYKEGVCCAFDAVIVGYDASTGAELWSAQDDDIRMLDGDVHMGLVVSPDNSTVFVGGSNCSAYPCHDMPFATAGYDASAGGRLWLSNYRSGGRTYLNDLAVSPDGSTVFVTGQEQPPCQSCEVTPVNAPLVAYDSSTGTERWVNVYDDNLGWALAVAPDSSAVYLAGTFTSSTASYARAFPGNARSLSKCTDECGYSTAAFNTGPGPGTSEETAPSPRYDGWRSSFDRTAYGGAYRASNTEGDTAMVKTLAASKVTWLTHLGPNQGKARILIDGRSRGVFDLFDAKRAAQAYTFDGLPYKAHTVKVKVLGTKRASSHGAWVAVDGFVVKKNMTRDSSAAIHYGGWTGSTKAAASGGSFRKSGRPTARVSFDFKGRKIAWVTAKGPAYGKAKVEIDGAAHIVDLYRATNSWRAKVWFAHLPRGEHHIKIRPLGTKNPLSTSTRVVFDAFVVRS